jgi:hypothetical protein
MKNRFLLSLTIKDDYGNQDLRYLRHFCDKILHKLNYCKKNFKIIHFNSTSNRWLNASIEIVH